MGEYDLQDLFNGGIGDGFFQIKVRLDDDDVLKVGEPYLNLKGLLKVSNH